MAPVIFEHPSSLEHDTGGHPEQAARITAIATALARHDWLGLERRRSEPASRAQLEAIHPARHIDALDALCARGGGQVDLDTVVSERSCLAARHAAGGAAQLASALLAGEVEWGASLHRPPGHHATRTQAMGFCLFNNVAVAAQHALDHGGASRVLILDWDVHHGNGTNDIFHDTDQVLFCSIHQSPLYPGTGPASDAGSGAGTGYTVNLPVAPGAGDEVFVSLVEHVVVALARSYEPQLILVSAGYDAHRDDPLAQCRVTDAGYAAMTAAVRRLGGELGAPVGIVLEGGYALSALASSVVATLRAMGDSGDGGGDAVSGIVPEALAARERLSRWWPDLA
jgi:acetoin utilization deacetylase AcuC-like enzyme